jgi:hypothetical protein
MNALPGQVRVESLDEGPGPGRSAAPADPPGAGDLRHAPGFL